MFEISSLLFSITAVIPSCKFKIHIASRAILSELKVNQVYVLLKSLQFSLIIWKIMRSSSGLSFDFFKLPQTPNRSSLIHSWIYKTKNFICFSLTMACNFPCFCVLKHTGFSLFLEFWLLLIYLPDFLFFKGNWNLTSPQKPSVFLILKNFFSTLLHIYHSQPLLITDLFDLPDTLPSLEKNIPCTSWALKRLYILKGSISMFLIYSLCISSVYVCWRTTKRQVK